MILFSVADREGADRIGRGPVPWLGWTYDARRAPES